MFRFLMIAVALAATVAAVLYLLEPSDHYSTADNVVSNGKQLFKNHCMSCHAMQEDGMGPPLGGVTKIVHEHELAAFIRNPAAVIAAGNERAQRLHTRYKQIMPSFSWMNDSAIHSILSFIHHETVLRDLQPFGLSMEPRKSSTLSRRIAKAVMKSQINIDIEEVVSLPRLKYSTPDLGIASLRSHPSGDGRLFISDQGGILYEINSGHPRIVVDMRSKIRDFSIGPGLATGLGSFDFHPDYLNNGLVYIAHAEKYLGQHADYSISDSVKAEVQWVLGEWKITGDSAIYRRELLRLHAPTFGHGAQDLSFVPGVPKGHPDYGLLYWGFGDGGSNNIRRPELGHHRRSFLGTILRIDPLGNNSANGKYGIPPDNPFAADQDPATIREIYAYGFRNPHRLAWDPTNSYRMMATDIGESNIEEINVIANGADYGWPNREGEFAINTLDDPKVVHPVMQGDRELFHDPFAQYDHADGFAVSGGYVYDGDLQVLRNKYIFGDIVSGKLFYVNISPDLTDSTVYEIFVRKGDGSTNFREMTGIRRLHLRLGYDWHLKRMYIFTKSDGKVYRISGATLNQ